MKKTAPTRMTEAAWMAFGENTYANMTFESDSMAWKPTPDGGCVAIRVRILNPNTFPRSWSEDEREQAMTASARAEIYRIYGDGNENTRHILAVATGEDAYALWGEPDKQSDLLGKRFDSFMRGE